MPIERQAGRSEDVRAATPACPRRRYVDPHHVIQDTALTLAERREILASWVSDANAVPDRPWLRQLESGFQVPVREIIEALKALDAVAQLPRGRGVEWNRREPPSDDDDDPPTAPAAAKRRDRRLNCPRDPRASPLERRFLKIAQQTRGVSCKPAPRKSPSGLLRQGPGG
jgi:hypothetical protein